MKTMTKIFALIAVFGFISTVSFAADSKTGQQDSTDCRQLSGQNLKGQNSNTAPSDEAKTVKSEKAN